jgi:hypothetical protein
LLRTTTTSGPSLSEEIGARNGRLRSIWLHVRFRSPGGYLKPGRHEDNEKSAVTKGASGTVSAGLAFLAVTGCGVASERSGDEVTAYRATEASSGRSYLPMTPRLSANWSGAPGDPTDVPSPVLINVRVGGANVEPGARE